MPTLFQKYPLLGGKMRQPVLKVVVAEEERQATWRGISISGEKKAEKNVCFTKECPESPEKGACYVFWSFASTAPDIPRACKRLHPEAYEQEIK